MNKGGMTLKDKVHGKSRLFRFFRGNGVFVALAVGLLAVGGVMATAFGQRWTATEQKPVETPVEQIVTNQPDDRVTTTTTTTKATTTTTTTAQSNALYVLPLTNTVQKAFSLEAPQYSDTMGDWRLHTGTDYAGEQGQSVKAIAAGEVVKVVDDPLWGGVVVIDHGVGVQSRYCGVTSSVQVGDRVEICEPIGVLSEIPCEAVQSAHLHLEILVDGQPVDPVAAIALEVRYAETTE